MSTLYKTAVTLRCFRPHKVHSRTLSTTPIFQLKGPPPPNTPPSAKQVGKTSSPADDPQSSAGSKDPVERDATGDDHPAKQPDTQAPSERSTGFNESGDKADGVKGGKAGLDQRTDK